MIVKLNELKILRAIEHFRTMKEVAEHLGCSPGALNRFCGKHHILSPQQRDRARDAHRRIVAGDGDQHDHFLSRTRDENARRLQRLKEEDANDFRRRNPGTDRAGSPGGSRPVET